MKRTREKLGLVAIAALTAGCTSSSTAAPAPTSAATTTTPSAAAAAPTSAAPTSAAPATSATSATATTSATVTTSTPAPAGPTQWLGYHSDPSRTGAAAAEPALAKATIAWTANLGGAVRGQPVVDANRIIAATEQNRVVALDPTTGQVLWSHTVGTPLTDVDTIAGCGDIDPLGITSTPVVDPASGTVYVVAEVETGSGVVHHQLQGLSVATGAVTLSEPVDPPLPSGESPAQLLQRASLALGNGRVYVSYGGNDGDCGHYHGWVVGVKETGAPDTVSFEVAADGEGGAVWQSGGAPAIDSAGDVYVTTGNANPDPPQGGPDPKAYTESVVRLSPQLRVLASFKDKVAGGDEDLSTGNPVLLPSDELFAVGKTDIGFVLKRSNLAQVAAITGICGSDPDGGPAYDKATNRIFVPCRGGGVQVVDLTSHTVGARLAGADSAPIVVGTSLWSLDHSAGVLSAFDAATGTKQQSVRVGTDVPIFTSPTAALGLLLVATTQGVTAIH